MTMTTWNPLSELEAMRQQLDRVFHQMWRGPRPQTWRKESEGPAYYQPAIELYTPDEGTLVVHVELPGLTADAITLELSEDTLHLSGELRREEKINEDAYFRSERNYGRFERHVALPYRVKEGEAKASFTHGLLTVRVPLAERVKRPQSRKLTLER
ncbi:MAG: Hsp20/alpha crystallin family protein [Candidatus Sericytochromatia bacterium]|nr:Hsp20/alpha crystallin family protein [Candidatus Sericytochromatia bacterium]